MIRPSSIALAARCLHPFTSGLADVDDESPSARVGHRTHEQIAGDLLGVQVDSSSWDERERILETAQRAVRLVARETYTETWIEQLAVIDLRSGAARLLPTSHEDVPAPPVHVLRGTIDFAGILPPHSVDGSRTLVVRDWKTGRQQHAVRAREHAQIRAYALMMARALGMRRVRAEVVYLESISGRDVPDIDGVELDAWDLAQIEQELRELLAAVERGPAPPTPGVHCTQLYCPLRGICAATTTALASVYPLPEPLPGPIATPERALYVLEHLGGAKAALDRVERELRAWAASHPVVLPDGRRWGRIETERRALDVSTPERAEALGILCDIAIDRVPTVTLASIERAVEDQIEHDYPPPARPPRGLKGARIAAAVAALEAAGGVKTSTSVRHDFYKPRKEEGE